MRTILVTGGAGYIGSHTVVELYSAGFDVVVVDNFCNSSPDVLERIRRISGKMPVLYECDVCDGALLQRIFKKHDIYAVIHFAGLKAVGESVAVPLKYYQNNLFSTITLLRVMGECGCKRIVFSSSATVYGAPERLPLTEDCALRTTNPYGATKLMIENIMRDVYASDGAWNMAILRYFNPIGAHSSGLIGENPQGIPNNLVPYIARVATGELKQLQVFGGDYDTPDGTGKRDYIHVVDLARGHVAALEKIEALGCRAINLGTGESYSVLDIVKAYEKACGKSIPYQIVPRRAGDIAECYASTELAKSLLGFKATHTLDQMCKDSFNFQKQC